MQDVFMMKDKRLITLYSSCLYLDIGRGSDQIASKRKRKFSAIAVRRRDTIKA